MDGDNSLSSSADGARRSALRQPRACGVYYVLPSEKWIKSAQKGFQRANAEMFWNFFHESLFKCIYM
ncbi:unnamed protein product [Cylicocyclus nassatus]|uniref:Uncharacterized protein n=1 Tax=Cylicocyclus nassatus TaxID=53992 RepID=A0AA36M898_CYLNA|nr:unnamed protein product [Cylicocyclus nassatus]